MKKLHGKTIKTVANTSMNEFVKPETTTKQTEWSTPQKVESKFMMMQVEAIMQLLKRWEWLGLLV